jgi:4-amino-4-deoxy-L-arabinose transferase-like glycosyltransferase
MRCEDKKFRHTYLPFMAAKQLSCFVANLEIFLPPWRVRLPAALSLAYNDFGQHQRKIELHGFFQFGTSTIESARCLGDIPKGKPPSRFFLMAGLSVVGLGLTALLLVVFAWRWPTPTCPNSTP